MRRLSNEACKTLKNNFLHLVVINIVDVNIGVIFNHSISSVRKELQMHNNHDVSRLIAIFLQNTNATFYKVV